MTVRLAVMGAGLIGRRHVEMIEASTTARLAAIVDPSPAAEAYAEAHGTAWFADFASMMATMRPDGVLVATPNQLHVAHGLDCIAAGLPVLVEKPLADDVAGAARLVEAAACAGVPLLVGHHRRHNPIIAAARQAIDDGRIGRVVAVHATCWFHKPAAYFEPAWRRAKGAGPVLTNLIHDVDLLRALCGEITTVQALDSNAVRGHAVEESAIALLCFDSGALGTLTVSDTIASPWSWEFTSGENPDYTHTPESTYLIGGTLGALSIPQLDLWTHGPTPDWFTPLQTTRLPCVQDSPLARQIDNFCAVIRGEAQPVVPGREGLQTLKVIAAIKEAAASGLTVQL